MIKIEREDDCWNEIDRKNCEFQRDKDGNLGVSEKKGLRMLC